MHYLLFHLDHDCFALDVARVREVLPLLEIRAIPRAPAAVAGVIVYTGATVPVIDLSELLLGRPAVQQFSTRIVLVHYPDADGNVHPLGLIAERATLTQALTRLQGCVAARVQLDEQQLGTLTQAFDAAAFRPPGIESPTARYLGDVAIGPNGLVQRIEVHDLLTPEIAALLFQPSEEA